MQENLFKTLSHIFRNQKLSIADIGATGGPEPRWKPWEELCFFYTFDPDPRMKPWHLDSKNYPIGLWSKKCTKILNLAAYPPATSLFQMDSEQVESFLNYASLEEVGKKKISVDTLDSVLKDEIVDFLKIDAEGAEFEILLGAKNKLSSGILGVQLEVCFCPIRKGVPLFRELDQAISAFDFQIYQLHREHWIRKNHLFNFQSEPQIIWGNALYLLKKKVFLERLEKSSDPETLFAKYLLILFAYHLYDYALEICEACKLDAAVAIKKNLLSLPRLKTSRLFSLLLSLFIGAGKYSLCFSSKTKKHRKCYLKRKIRELGTACLHLGKNDYALFDE